MTSSLVQFFRMLRRATGSRVAAIRRHEQGQRRSPTATSKRAVPFSELNLGHSFQLVAYLADVFLRQNRTLFANVGKHLLRIQNAYRLQCRPLDPPAGEDEYRNRLFMIPLPQACLSPFAASTLAFGENPRGHAFI